MAWGAFYNKEPKNHFGYFSKEDLAVIKESVKRAEAETRGEIRVKIRQSFDLGITTIEEQAVRDFEQEGLLNTCERTGVLVLLVMDERRFAIRADKGIYEKLPQFYWDKKAHDLAGHFKKDTPIEGLVAVISDIGYWLSRSFPRRPDDVNELSDEIIVDDGR